MMFNYMEENMKLGEYQDLYYIKKVDFGVYLAEDLKSETHVLLPANRFRRMPDRERKCMSSCTKILRID